NSPVAYNPSAAELIALKNRGISEDILTALVERGAQVKAQARQAAPSRPTSPVPNPPPPYAYPYPYQYQYAYPAYAGAYPGYSGYGGYPYYALPSVPLTSFNNSFPTYINGYPVYSGYYVPGYGYLW
ncbi:MAG TPA: hypothetical protein VNT26_09195, partial [Candidatus Sulfotelmatobacter sp.]|nr:hypothetical protein [Candidatus Sulfotelmatobacter sp.]